MRGHQPVASPPAWQRDAPIAAAWTTYQTEARRLRQEFQTAQAADNATLRNAMATADQTQINAVTQARELYTNSVEDERHEATVDRANDWVSKISQLVSLNATSSNGLAQSLADAIRNMATQYPVTTIGGMSALGQPMGVSQANPFWMALANKAELAADYLSSVNRAQTNYLTGRTEIVGGDLAIMFPGMLQHQADLRISQSAATRDYNKATVGAAGQRDRTPANARTNLAAAKGTWEQGLVSQTDTNTTVAKPSLDPPTTQPPTASTTARQLSTLFSGGLVSAEPTPQQNGTSNADATDEDLETIPINETPAPVDPPSRPTIPLNIWTGPLPVQAEPTIETLPTEPTAPSESPAAVLDPILPSGEEVSRRGAAAVGTGHVEWSQSEGLINQILESENDARPQASAASPSAPLTTVIIIVASDGAFNGQNDATRKLLLDPLTAAFRQRNLDYEIDVRNDILMHPEDYPVMPLLEVAAQLGFLEESYRRFSNPTSVEAAGQMLAEIRSTISDGADVAADFLDEYYVIQRIVALLEMGGGVVEMYGGAAMVSASGVAEVGSAGLLTPAAAATAAGGVVVYFVGADHFATGYDNFANPESWRNSRTRGLLTYVTGREDTASAMEFGIGMIGGLGPSGVHAVGVRLDNAGRYVAGFASDVWLAENIAAMRVGGRLNAILSPDPDAFKAFLSTLRDGRQIRAFLKEIEDELLTTYNAEFQALLRRRVEYPDAAKHIAALVEERMKLAGIGRGLNVDTQVIVNHLSDGIVALRRDNLTSYRIADLQIASGQKIIIELTLEDIRSLRGMADWTRMSVHKNGQLSDYAISGAHITIITPW